MCSVKDDPPGGGDIPRADGLPRGLLHEARGEDHPGQAFQVESCFTHVYSVCTNKYALVFIFMYAQYSTVHCPINLNSILRLSYFRLSLIVPTFTALFSVVLHDRIRDFLICSSREEDLRFDLNDFWLEEVCPMSTF